MAETLLDWDTAHGEVLGEVTGLVAGLEGDGAVDGCVEGALLGAVDGHGFVTGVPDGAWVGVGFVVPGV